MYKDYKLKESNYFYSQLLKETNIEEFKYNLNSSITAARSVMQYTLEEVRNKPGGKKWYDTNINMSKIFKFFKDTRAHDIHEKPVEPIQHTKVILTKTNPGLTDSISMITHDSKGNPIKYCQSEPSPQSITNNSPSIMTTRYEFTDWPGSEDVITLCRLYLEELQVLVEDGRKKGFLDTAARL